jgi:hypothetical protein
LFADKILQDLIFYLYDKTCEICETPPIGSGRGFAGLQTVCETSAKRLRKSSQCRNDYAELSGVSQISQIAGNQVRETVLGEFRRFRRYFADDENWLGIKAGRGFAGFADFVMGLNRKTGFWL